MGTECHFEAPAFVTLSCKELELGLELGLGRFGVGIRVGPVGGSDRYPNPNLTP